MDEPGYVYVLANASMSGLVKVGRTTRDPEARARELSTASGVPTPFVVVYDAYFLECGRAERFVHSYLEAKMYRVSDNREFFQAPVKEAVAAVLAAQTEMAKSVEGRGGAAVSVEGDGNDQSRKHLSPAAPGATPIWQAVFDMAEIAEYGAGNSFRDLRKALSLYKQAAKLGSAEACLRIGRIYSCGNTFPEEKLRDLALALEYLEEGARLGALSCYPEMAGAFKELNQIDQAEKAWMLYFSAAEAESDVVFGSYACRYLTFLKEYRLALPSEPILNTLRKHRETVMKSALWPPDARFISAVLYPEEERLWRRGHIDWIKIEDEAARGFIAFADGTERAFFTQRELLWDWHLSPPRVGLCVRCEVFKLGVRDPASGVMVYKPQAANIERE